MLDKNIRFACSSFAVAAALTAFASPALAQVAETKPAAADAAAEGEEADDRDNMIVVTANRREQDLRDVPVAVTSLSSELLESAGVANTEALVTLTPALSFNRHLSPFQSTIRIRGVGTNVSSPTIEPSVSMIVDGVVVARQGAFFTELADIERVEVLRGPQSTLFGKNAAAGAVNITTREPNRVGFDGSLDATYDSLSQVRVRGTASAPFNEKLAGRITASYVSNGDSIIENVNPNGPSLDGGEAYVVRGKLLWEPIEDMSWLLIADYGEASGPNSVRVPVAFESPAVQNLYGVGPVDSDNRRVNLDGGLFKKHEYENTDTGVSLQGDWMLGDIGVRSITAYRSWQNVSFLDIDGHGVTVTPSGYDDPVLIPGVGSVATGRFPLIGSSQTWGDIDSNQMSQEIVFTSPGDSAFRWLAGVFYWKTDLAFDYKQNTRLCPLNSAAPGFAPGAPVIGDGDPGALTGACTFPPPAGVNVSSRTIYDVDTEYLAGFGQIELDVTPQLTVALGARYQSDTFDYSVRGGLGGSGLVAGTAPAPGAPFSGAGSETEEVWTGRASVKYSLTDSANVYASYSRGYKGPGLDTPANLTRFEPALESETVDAYEIGLRSGFLDERVVVNITGFLQEYQNLQQSAFNTATATLTALNAGEGRQRGFEADLTFEPVDDLIVNTSVVYLDAEYTFFPNADCWAPRTQNTNCTYLPSTGARPGIQDVSGQPLIYSPEWSGTLSANYRRNLASGVDGLFGGDIRYVGEQQTQASQDPNGWLDAYTIVNLHAGVEFGYGRYTLTGFVNNALDEGYGIFQFNWNYSGFANPNPRNTVVQVIPRDAERIYGMTLRIKS